VEDASQNNQTVQHETRLSVPPITAIGEKNTNSPSSHNHHRANVDTAPAQSPNTDTAFASHRSHLRTQSGSTPQINEDGMAPNSQTPTSEFLPPTLPVVDPPSSRPIRSTRSSAPLAVEPVVLSSYKCKWCKRIDQCVRQVSGVVALKLVRKGHIKIRSIWLVYHARILDVNVTWPIIQVSGCYRLTNTDPSVVITCSCSIANVLIFGLVNKIHNIVCSVVPFKDMRGEFR
jgi:hypothetical protein